MPAHKAAARHLKSKIWPRLAAEYFSPTQQQQQQALPLCCCNSSSSSNMQHMLRNTTRCCTSSWRFEEETRHIHRTRQDTARLAAEAAGAAATSKLGQHPRTTASPGLTGCVVGLTGAWHIIYTRVYYFQLKCRRQIS